MSEVTVDEHTVIALSSGEAEFYSIVKGATMGLQSRQILEGFGAPCELEILSDSSAARGICMRSGSVKVRNSSIKEPWVQELFRKGELKLDKVDTLLHWADVGTKASGKERLDVLMLQMPLFHRKVLTGTRLAVAASLFLGLVE